VTGYRRGVAYREFASPPALRGAVECGWIAALDDGESPHVQSVLPDGCMDLIWSGSEVLVAGPDTAAHAVTRRPGGTLVGLRFAPGALAARLGLPASELRDQRVPLADLHPRPARAAAARLAGQAEATAVLTAVALALPGHPDPAVRALMNEIAAGAGVAATADVLGWTVRTLHRRCLHAFGYGPAVLRRVLRFRHAADLLHAGVAPAEVAAIAGYADQPHLSREVRALAGASPRQLASGANRSTPLPSGSSTTA
jgi:AraC-like DNA-binding protein